MGLLGRPQRAIEAMLDRLGYTLQTREEALRVSKEIAVLRETVRHLAQEAAMNGRTAPPAAETVPFDGFVDHCVELPLIEVLSDEELGLLNRLLPWAAFVVDRRGRRFGNAWSETKRNMPQRIPDPRIVELDRRFPLGQRTVLEIGCFEGIHTIALAERSARLVAVDSRIENVVKTIVRCAMAGVRPLVVPWNVESPPPALVDPSWDVVHHVGVLYHLIDPVDHLRRISSVAREVIMLDTHVADDGTANSEYESGGRRYRYFRYREGTRAEPFAGMADHAKWLVLEDVQELLTRFGFRTIDVAARTMERNGPRVLIYANR